jgi:hypothetical protein
VAASVLSKNVLRGFMHRLVVVVVVSSGGVSVVVPPVIVLKPFGLQGSYKKRKQMSHKSSAAGPVIGILFAIVAVGFLIWAYRYLRGMGYVTLALGNQEPNQYEAGHDVENQVEFAGSNNPLYNGNNNNSAREGSSGRTSSHRTDESIEQVVVDTGVLKAGYLSKLSSGMSREWQVRWFFIRSGRLYYCQKPSDLFGKQYIEAVCVANLLISTVREVSPNEFQIISPGQRKSGYGGGGEYSLYSDDPKEVEDWVTFIRQQIQNQLTNNSPTTSSGATQASGNETVFKELTTEKLTALRALNPTCADCGTPNPDWASLNLCIVVCIECSGIHRSLGTHVSKVRSLTLDKWSANCYQLLMDVGNNYASCYWEYDNARVSKEKPTFSAGRDMKEAFIANKYVNRVYVANSDQNANGTLLAACVKGSLIEAYSALARGAQIDATSGPDRALRSALHHAVSSKNALLVELLCLWNADVMAVDAGGKTAMKIATERNFKDISTVLTLYGAKL